LSKPDIVACLSNFLKQNNEQLDTEFRFGYTVPIIGHLIFIIIYSAFFFIIFAHFYILYTIIVVIVVEWSVAGQNQFNDYIRQSRSKPHKFRLEPVPDRFTLLI